MKFCEIRILTDENISPKVLPFLRERGIDVIDTKEQSWHGKYVTIRGAFPIFCKKLINLW
ncbi:hypothetical protein KsCSTR_23680 [Candidatus Kuenenia stuttgartiensis]|jgi:hypothetical protein|uniref:DUF5615 domain-containing protein n=1 Tax=Kuenenia stuttgartiensis TaxID=174633 RepID=Q1Q3Q5_KUEST|nr:MULTISPECIES: hypothetical protein [Kuenenia]MBE7546884.1 hypothetical protein [Planctomycetia bacterium]MCL4727469.1 hypothetical protein [Candidatus Kuenenia stuttgartiensis]MCZ7623186.1 hypothetical protein [Candidatus Kuenenia sp.]QII11747.1 hypothetical protein KsCSTR_23680 [Candidatus Kuenenia stuttgartiensis]CAJ74638.1 unknown protein [Candidatus Kuenenia stuttgartiensis]